MLDDKIESSIRSGCSGGEVLHECESSNGSTESDGSKASDKSEAFQGIKFPIGPDVGKITYDMEAREAYVDHVIQTVPMDLTGMKIVVDCAEGASYYTSVEALKRLGGNVIPIHNSPDGTNINAGCGSTHMEELQAKVIQEKAEIGLAFDGDADRLLAVDENGRIVDGDQIMAIVGNHIKSQGKLKKDTIVATVMSNLGFFLMGKKNGLTIEQTKVGDRYWSA